VLRGIDLSVPQGAITGRHWYVRLGQTTLLSVLNGGRVPEKGTVINSSSGPSASSTLLQHRGRPQASTDYALTVDLPPRQRLSASRPAADAVVLLPWPKHVQIRAWSLDEVVCVEIAHASGRLSGGDGNASPLPALIRQPKLMIADEPLHRWIQVSRIGLRTLSAELSRSTT